MLSLLIFIPLLIVVLLFWVPSGMGAVFRWASLLSCLSQLAISLYCYLNFSQQASSFQFVERIPWIKFHIGQLGTFSADYFLGIDGISLPMVVLAGIVMLTGVIASWKQEVRVKGYFLLYLLLSAAIMGCFVALDFLLFFLFFEFMLLPMYFLIGIWGGKRREYAALKFLIYTLVGSVCVLIVMIGLYLSVVDISQTAVAMGLDTKPLTEVRTALQSGQISPHHLVHTFDIPAMMNRENFIPGSLMTKFAGAAFLCLCLGFAIKLPAVPVHTWLPDAHVEASTPISVVLAGILLKIGGYGLIRIAYSIFPDQAQVYAPLIASVGLVSILYAAFNALASTDLKRLIAYSSVSHMGFVLLGLASMTPEGISGAVYQMFSHGILSAMLFLLVGVLYDRTHDRTISYYRGLSKMMPAYTSLMTIGCFASLGLPGFCGFIGELLALAGSFSTSLFSKWLAVLSSLGLILGAAYFLWALQRMFFGKIWLKEASWQNSLTDLTPRELGLLGALAFLALVFGLFPGLMLENMQAAVLSLF